MTAEEKIRENRLRRMADRQGLRLSKSRARDPRALTYERWNIADARGVIVAGATPWPYSLSVDDVEDYLTGEEKR